MLQVYKVFVRPHLEHAVTAWSPWHRKDIETIEKIQHRATRRMSDIRGSYPEGVNQLELTTLEERRMRGDAIETFKYLKGFLDINRQSFHYTQYRPAPNPTSTHPYAADSASSEHRST